MNKHNKKLWKHQQIYNDDKQKYIFIVFTETIGTAIVSKATKKEIREYINNNNLNPQDYMIKRG